MRDPSFHKCSEWHAHRRTTVSQRDWMNTMRAIQDYQMQNEAVWPPNCPRCFEVVAQAEKSRRFDMWKLFSTAGSDFQRVGIEMIYIGKLNLGSSELSPQRHQCGTHLKFRWTCWASTMTLIWTQHRSHANPRWVRWGSIFWDPPILPSTHTYTSLSKISHL